MKPKRVAGPGQVFVQWRFQHEWRDGSNHDRHWKFYGVAKRSDAATFMSKKAPSDTMFQFRIREPQEVKTMPEQATMQ